MLQRVGVVVQMTSSPLLMAPGPAPDRKLLLQPRPCRSMGAASGSGPTAVTGVSVSVFRFR
jgi:hypothetical protein